MVGDSGGDVDLKRDYLTDGNSRRSRSELSLACFSVSEARFITVSEARFITRSAAALAVSYCTTH